MALTSKIKVALVNALQQGISMEEFCTTNDIKYKTILPTLQKMWTTLNTKGYIEHTIEKIEDTESTEVDFRMRVIKKLGENSVPAGAASKVLDMAAKQFNLESMTDEQIISVCILLYNPSAAHRSDPSLRSGVVVMTPEISEIISIRNNERR